MRIMFGEPMAWAVIVIAICSGLTMSGYSEDQVRIAAAVSAAKVALAQECTKQTMLRISAGQQPLECAK
jgi:hypothetical protein